MDGGGRGRRLTPSPLQPGIIHVQKVQQAAQEREEEEEEEEEEGKEGGGGREEGKEGGGRGGGGGGGNPPQQQKEKCLDSLLNRKNEESTCSTIQRHLNYS